jgi:uncharacterized protein
MPMIRETIVSTMNGAGQVHFAPLGIIAEDDGWIIAPFRPSTTLDNLRSVPFAVANYTDDVRIFAGCLTGRGQWPTAPCGEIAIPRFAGALAHAELAVTHTREKVEREIAYLEIAVSKTASAAEEEAWTWLMERILAFYAGTGEETAT